MQKKSDVELLVNNIETVWCCIVTYIYHGADKVAILMTLAQYNSSITDFYQPWEIEEVEYKTYELLNEYWSVCTIINS